MNPTTNTLGPLQDGSHVVIIGGGPGGVGTALALDQRARQMGRRIEITLFEGKVFEGERHFNQCAGVLSPPIEQIMQDDLGIPFPHHLVQREITGYILHSDRRAILLEKDDPPAYSVRRIQFDHYLMEQARLRGVQVINSRVTDLEFHPDRVMVYSESGNSEADAVVGAFGLDEGTAAAFERATPYRAPRFLTSIVTKLHPGKDVMTAFGNHIHAYLPSTRGIEFGAVTPKGNHLTMNIAGERVDTHLMDLFLASDAVQSVVPCMGCGLGENDLAYFKGRFPISVARQFSGNRYVIVGDAAGLMRPFKGKGVNSAILTGIWAAQTMLQDGISAQALRRYHRACCVITNDMPYGKAIRALTIRMSKWNLFDVVIALAEQDIALRHALFDAVSAHRAYRDIVHDTVNPRWIARMALLLAALPFRVRGEKTVRV